jgi:hypothetical protein
MVVFTREPSGGRILDLTHGFHSLNGTAADLLERALRLDRSQTLGGYAKDHGISPTQARVDFDELGRSLDRLRLLAHSSRRIGQLVRRMMASAFAKIAFASLILWKCSPHFCTRLLLTIAWCSIRLAGYSYVLQAWREKAFDSARGPLTEIDRIDRLVKELCCSYLIPPCACKERAIVAQLLTQAIVASNSTVVLAFRSTPFLAHTWAEVDGNVVGDDAEFCASLRRVATLAPASQEDFHA